MTGQRGVALITALLVTAIATIAAVSMMSRQHLDVRRSANIFAVDQAWEFSQGIESWAVHIMYRDGRDNNTDHLGEDWATVLPPIEVEGGVVAGKIEDLQARFNLNNLVRDGEVSNPDVALLKRLFDVLDIDNKAVQAIVDWIDKDEKMTFPDGAEDNVYLGRDPAYRSANTLMASPSELLLVAGIGQEDYQALRPFVCALPERTAVNVNTAPVEVLQALVSGMESADAEQLLSEREETPFKSVQDFRNHALVKKYMTAGAGQGNSEDMSVSSNYFLLSSTAQYQQAEVRLASVIVRDDSGTRIIQHGMEDY